MHVLHIAYYKIHKSIKEVKGSIWERKIERGA